MASCESNRPSAYDEDLHWRIVWQKEALGYSYEKVVDNLNIDKSTVYRIIKLFLNTGTITKRPYPQDRTARKLTYPAQLLILHLVMEKPGITLHEIQEELLGLLLIKIDASNICRFIQQSGFTRQRLRITALQKDELLRQQYIMEVSTYNPEMLIFLDETGAD